MENYEQISENCKMLWKEKFNLTNERYTQVSGYVFNEKNQLLIVKNGNSWTVPGGHPEANEDKIETLQRELMEEAYVTLKDIKYLGSVEVVENDDTYYQTRYTAKVDKILTFKGEFEISERKFVDLDNLANYIKWANGITFSAQIKSARKMWGI